MGRLGAEQAAVPVPHPTSSLFQRPELPPTTWDPRPLHQVNRSVLWCRAITVILTQVKYPVKGLQMYWWIASLKAQHPPRAGKPGSLVCQTCANGWETGEGAERPAALAAPPLPAPSASRPLARAGAASPLPSPPGQRQPRADRQVRARSPGPRPLRAPGTLCGPPRFVRRGAAERTAEARTAPGEGGRAVRCPRGCGGAAGG